MITIGSVLSTKDGRVIGNGIVIDLYYNTAVDDLVYTIKTDFGNLVNITERELHSCFHTESARFNSPRHQYIDQLKLLVGIANRFGFNTHGN